MTRTEPQPDERLLTPYEVATLFGVGIKTVRNWAKNGQLHPITTLGGHRRYRESEVMALVNRTSN